MGDNDRDDTQQHDREEDWQARIRDALAGVTDPERGADLVTLTMVSGVAVKDRMAQVSLEIDPARAERFEPVRRQAEAAVRAIPGLLSAVVVLTSEREGGATPNAPSGSGAGSAPAPAPARASSPPGHAPLPTTAAADGVNTAGIGHIVAVASGKGGVGKSTTAVNLALALAASGLTVGILDADVYGPSLPRLLGISGRPDAAGDKTLLPMERFGLKTMSMGFLVAEDQPVIWRGPMVMGALRQMFADVAWGVLDVMIVDMPPGTGDAQLTISQHMQPSGAVIVSTPQDIALLDARKGLNMFRKVNVPVLGLVENMSTFFCPNCGHESHIFDHGGARRVAEMLDCPFLGEVPLDMMIRETSDAGTPVMVQAPDGPQAAAYMRIAASLRTSLQEQNGATG